MTDPNWVAKIREKYDPAPSRGGAGWKAKPLRFNYKEAIIMQFVNGWTNAETAEWLGVSQGTYENNKATNDAKEIKTFLEEFGKDNQRVVERLLVERMPDVFRRYVFCAEMLEDKGDFEAAGKMWQKILDAGKFWEKQKVDINLDAQTIHINIPRDELFHSEAQEALPEAEYEVEDDDQA